VTALCPGGGTSQPKAGHAAVVQYSAGLIASIFAAYDLAWLIPIIPLLSFSNQVLATFCAADPPTVTALTAAESNALLNLQFGSDFDTGLAKVRDLYLNVIWHDACECASGTATPLTPPAPPAGTPIFQPPVAPAVTPCGTVANGPATVAGTAAAFRGWLLWPGFAATYAVVTCKNTVLSGAGHACTTLLSTTDANGVEPAGNTEQSTTTPAGGTTTVNFNILPGIFGIECDLTDAGGTGDSQMDYTATLYCGAPPGATTTPCCPPDVATQASLDVILRQVNLLQRQVAPFAYVYGANHVALTGNGSFAVQGLLGCSVDVTTLPTSYGQEAGTPTELFDLGFVTLGTADGWELSRRIDHDGSLVLPRAAGVFTLLGYTLRPGVVVSIRELVREP
jgi:hypothetical protein